MLETILIVLALKALWVFFALASAKFEGHYFDLKYFYGSRGHKNQHPVLNVIRAIVMVSLTWGTWYQLHWVDSLVFGGSCFFSFSFFHNGMFYCTRNNLSPEIYKKRWWANKESGKDDKAANVEITVGFRTAMFVAAVIALIWIFRDAYYY